jgi:O-methyltransferase involved in polyketide biosynthesis
VDAHPEGLVVNLGAGLDTRFYRLDNGTIVVPRSEGALRR